MPFMQTWNQAVLDYIFQLEASLTQPGNLDVALSTTTPNQDGTGITEPTGGAYARAETVPADWGRSGDEVSNAEVINFPEATASWGTATHFVLYDNTTPIGFGALQSPVAIGTGIQPRFNVGQLVVEYIYS